MPAPRSLTYRCWRHAALGLSVTLLLAAGLSCGGQSDPFARHFPRATPTPAASARPAALRAGAVAAARAAWEARYER